MIIWILTGNRNQGKEQEKHYTSIGHKMRKENQKSYPMTYNKWSKSKIDEKMYKHIFCWKPLEIHLKA